MKYNLEVTVYDPVLPPRTFVCRGGVARSLLYLVANAAGATKMQAVDDERIGSLQQHVHILRRKFGLNIVTEYVPHTGRDGNAIFGRYHLKSQIRIRHLSGGAS